MYGQKVSNDLIHELLDVVLFACDFVSFTMSYRLCNWKEQSH